MNLTFKSILFCMLIFGCTTPKKIEHSFFIAGHAYGDPREKANNKGLYKPFKDKIPYINNEKNMNNGFLLGDIAWGPKWWSYTKDDITKFNMPIHVVRGNHDGPLKQFEKNFGKSYYSFVQNKDLFIILDANIDGWSISGKQLIFLKNTLRNKRDKVNNIFIFSHQLLWWNKEEFAKPKPNSLHGKKEETNFWSTIEPLLRSQSKPVFLFAGDVGAFSKKYRKRDHTIEYSYHNYDNITFIASGMGGGVRDNFVIVDVYNDGSVEFRFIHLNGDNINSLGKLEDYVNPN